MNIKEQISKALDKALGEPVKPTPEPPTPHQRIRSLVSEPQLNVDGRRQSPQRAKYQRHSQVRRVIAASLKIAPAKIDQLRALQQRMDEVYAELVSIAEASANRVEHQRTINRGQKIASGNPAESLSPYVPATFDREGQLTALKSALVNLSREAHPLVKEIQRAAAAEGQKLLDAEIALDCDRYGKYDIPQEEPSEIVRSVAECVLQLQTIAAATTEPAHYAPIRATLKDLVTL